MIKKSLVLCALAMSLPFAFAHAAGITLTQTSGTSSAVYYLPTTSLGFVPGEMVVGVFRPDDSLVDLIFEPAEGYECFAHTNLNPPTNGYVDLAKDFSIDSCAFEGQNPYGTYTFVEAPFEYLTSVCLWGQRDANDHVFSPTGLHECIDSFGPLATYATYNWLAPDFTPPVISPLVDVTAEATSSNGTIVSYLEPTATDDRDGAVPVACAPASGTLFTIGTTSVTCTASDMSGNIATSTFQVVVHAPPPSKSPADPCSIKLPFGLTVTCISISIPERPKLPQIPKPPHELRPVIFPKFITVRK